MGRRRKGEDVRKVTLGMACTPAEKERVIKRARDAELTVSMFLRRCVAAEFRRLREAEGEVRQ